MKYSQELVWKAVYVVLPKYKVVRDAGIQINLPEALQSAAVEFFMIENGPYTRPSTDSVYAKGVVYDSLAELRANGFLSFGTVNEFWGSEE